MFSRHDWRFKGPRQRTRGAHLADLVEPLLVRFEFSFERLVPHDFPLYVAQVAVGFFGGDVVAVVQPVVHLLKHKYVNNLPDTNTRIGDGGEGGEDGDGDGGGGGDGGGDGDDRDGGGDDGDDDDDDDDASGNGGVGNSGDNNDCDDDKDTE